MIYTEKLLETVSCEPICSCCFLSQNFKLGDQTFLILKKKKSKCLPKRNIVSFHQELFSDESIVCVAGEHPESRVGSESQHMFLLFGSCFPHDIQHIPIKASLVIYFLNWKYFVLLVLSFT